MADHREPTFDGDGGSSSTSSFQRAVVLRDWWLIKCSNEFEGKRFGVAGAEESVKSRAMRVFKSAPIIKALDVFTLQASDGIFITLRGYLNKELVIKNGFKPEIAREFIFGFPPRWERICNNCFEEVPSIIKKASTPILSPCKYSKENLEDNPAESRDKTSLTETNTAEINKKVCSRARDKITTTRKSLHLKSKSGGESTEDERKLKSSEVKNTTNDGDHGSIGMNKAKIGDVEEDEGNAICTEDNERKLGECKTKNRSIEGDLGSEILDKAKSRDVEIYEGEVIDNEVTLPADGCGRKRGEDRVGRVTTRSAAKESLTSEQRTDELKVTRASPHSLFKDSDKTSKPGKQGTSKKSGKILKSDSNRSVNVVKSARNKRKLKSSEVKNTTNDGDHGSIGLNKTKSGDVEEDECMAIYNEDNKRKLGERKIKNGPNDGDRVSELLDKANSRDVEIGEGEAVDNEVTLPADGCGRERGEDRVGRETTSSAARELLTSEQRTDELRVTRVSPHSLFKDSDKTSKPRKQGTSKKSAKILKSDSNHSVNVVNSAGNKRKLNASKVQNPTTNDGDHDSKGLNKRYSGTDSVGKLKSNSKPDKKGKSKKSVKNLKCDCNVVTPMHNSGSKANKAEGHLSWEKTKRKIDFDVEVTPDKPKADAASTNSLGQKRSRSGRVLVATLEFWRNQIPVYDRDRNLIQVKDDRETNSTPSSKGKVSDSRKRRK